jgi:UDP-glucose 4-epimerase
MKVLITGGTGFIGSHTAIALLEAGHDIFIVDDLSNSSKGVLDLIKLVSKTSKDIPFEKLDVRDEELLTTLFKREHFDAVIHFAGLKAVGESVLYPLRYWDVNLGSTISLLKAMSSVGCTKLVFSSSACVYGVTDSAVIEENSPLHPVNPYGQTKVANEQLVRDFSAYGECISLRYFNPVGAHPSGLIGELPNGYPNNLFPFIQEVLSGQRECLRIFGSDYDTPDGTGVRDYIHIMDLAKGHIAALECLEPGFKAINLGTGQGHSVLEVAKAFGCPYEFAERRAGDTVNCVAHTGKAKKLLGWSSELGLRDMVADTLRWCDSR